MQTNTDPFYPNVPEKCYVVIEGATVGVGIVKRGFQGYGLVYDYTPQVASIGYQACVDAARTVVTRYNVALGLTSAQEMACKIGSMRGWHVPGANPAKWVDRMVSV